MKLTKGKIIAALLILAVLAAAFFLPDLKNGGSDAAPIQNAAQNGAQDTPDVQDTPDAEDTPEAEDAPDAKQGPCLRSLRYGLP